MDTKVQIVRTWIWSHYSRFQGLYTLYRVRVFNETTTKSSGKFQGSWGAKTSWDGCILNFSHTEGPKWLSSCSVLLFNLRVLPRSCSTPWIQGFLHFTGRRHRLADRPDQAGRLKVRHVHLPSQVWRHPWKMRVLVNKFWICTLKRGLVHPSKLRIRT